MSADQVLTNLTIYWLTGTIGSSMHMYANAQELRDFFRPYRSVSADRPGPAAP